MTILKNLSFIGENQMKIRTVASEISPNKHKLFTTTKTNKLLKKLNKLFCNNRNTYIVFLFSPYTIKRRAKALYGNSLDEDLIRSSNIHIFSFCISNY